MQGEVNFSAEVQSSAKPKKLSFDERLKGINLTYRDVYVNTGNSDITIINTEEEEQYVGDVIIYPIAVVSKKTGELRVIGKAHLRKIFNSRSPVLVNIDLKTKYRSVNGLLAVIINSLFEKFGEYMVNKVSVKDPNTIKFLTQVLNCPLEGNNIIFTKEAFKEMRSLEEKIRGGA